MWWDQGLPRRRQKRWPFLLKKFDASRWEIQTIKFEIWCVSTDKNELRLNYRVYITKYCPDGSKKIAIFLFWERAKLGKIWRLQVGNSKMLTYFIILQPFEASYQTKKCICTSLKMKISTFWAWAHFCQWPYLKYGLNFPPGGAKLFEQKWPSFLTPSGQALL